MRRYLVALTALVLASCADTARLTGPVEQVNVFGGLEQKLTIGPVSPELDPSGKMFDLRSTLVNRGDAPVTVRVVRCWLDPEHHIRTSADFTGVAVMDLCDSPDVVTLAPGQSTDPAIFVGVIGRPGRYRLKVRHALDPEHWGEITVQAK